MNLDNYFYCFPEAVPRRFCDEVIEFASNQKDQLGVTGKYEKEQALSKREIEGLKNKRDSKVVWLNEPWIYEEIHPFIHEANKLGGWNFEWDHSEICQFTKYNLNQHYDWHCDSGAKPYMKKGNHPHNGKIRKLSSILSLSDSKDYAGGEIEFDFRNYEPPFRDDSQHIMRVPGSSVKGTFIVFPSFVWHRVKPLTAGKRNSLVCWHLGRPFK